MHDRTFDPLVLASLKELSQKHSGPTLFFDLEAIEKRMVFLKTLSARYDCRFLMAVKSFPHPKVIRLASRFLDGFDVSNFNEWRAVSKSTRAGGLTWITSPVACLSSEQMFARPPRNSVFSCDSRAQLHALGAFKSPVNYAIRLNTTAGVEVSRFGIDPADASEVKSLASAGRHRFVGFHLHHGFQKNRPADYIAFGKTIARLCDRTRIRPKFINFGGGLATLTPTQLENVLAELREIVSPKTTLCFEPGRFLSEHAGYAIGRVVNVRASRRAQECVIDLSRLCHLHWSNARAMIVSDKLAGAKKTRLGGPTCSEHDVFGHVKAPPLALGDLIYFKGVSGYSVAWNRGFNGIKPAKVVFESLTSS